MALGRGLNALLPQRADEIIHIDIDKIIPSGSQPRRVFRDDTLKELSASIKETGILQPIIVSKSKGDLYRLIAGERRWRAAKLAGLTKIPALIKDVTPQSALEIALIENIQRDDLNPIETAEALQRLNEEFNLSQEDLSKKVGKDRSTISNYLRILRLPDEVKSYIDNNALSIGHAKALLTSQGENKQIEAAKKIIKYALSVRAAESLCKRLANPQIIEKTKKLPEITELEDKLINALKTKVKIRHKGQKGKIEIEYYSPD